MRIEKVDKLSRRLDLRVGINKEGMGKKNNKSGSRRIRNRAIKGNKRNKRKR